MNWKSAYRNFSLLLLIVSMTACSMSVTRQTSEPVPTQPVVDTKPPATDIPSPAETSVGTPSGLCANPYYPVREGATWTYASTGGPTGGYDFTDRITAVTDDGFTL